MPDSYSLREVAELLGTSLDGVVRRVESGEFPGRFLTASLERRIPVADVRRSLETHRPQARDGDWASTPGESVPVPEAAVAVDGGLLQSVQRSLDRQDQRWGELMDAVLELRQAVEQVRRDVAEMHHPPEPLHLLAGPTSEAELSLDVDGVLREVAELESMLGLSEEP